MELEQLMAEVREDAERKGSDVEYELDASGTSVGITMLMDDMPAANYEITDIPKFLDEVVKEKGDENHPDALVDAFWRVANDHYQLP